MAGGLAAVGLARALRRGRRALQDRWSADLAAAVGALEENAHAFARRFLLGLDGLALHVLAGHITTPEARELAMTTLRVELRLPYA